MDNSFIFNIDPDDLPFRGEDDLGDDEPRIVEYIAKQIQKQDAMFVINPPRFAKAMQIIKTVIMSVSALIPETQYSLEYDPLIGKSMALILIAPIICLDNPLLDAIREMDDGIIRSIDIEPRTDDTVELTIDFKDVRFRLAREGSK